MRRAACLSALCALLLLAPCPASAAPTRQESGLPLPAPQPGRRPYYALPHPATLSRGDFSGGLLGDLFIMYRLISRQDTLFNEIELTRLQIGAWASYRGLVGVNATFETIRSSSSRSYFGIDGDSIIPRVRYAFVEVTPLGRWLSLRGGLVPDLILPWAERSWDLRALGQTGLERDGLVSTGDLGATIEAALPLELGLVQLAYGNGEGGALREQNNGKNTTAALHLRPARHHLPDLMLHAIYRDGSIGAGSAADHRLIGGLSYTGWRFGGGALGSWARGYRGVGDRDAGHVQVWARGQLPYRFLLFARAEVLWPDVSDVGSLQARVLAGAGYALPMIARLHIAYEGTVPAGALSRQAPAVQEHALLVVAEARL